MVFRMPSAGRSSRFRWTVLGLATAMQLGLSLPQQTPAAIGPILVHDLHLSHTELGLLTSAIWGGMLLGMLPAGLLSDRLGERFVVLGGGVVLAAFLLLASGARAFAPLFLLLVPAAVGAAAGSPGGTRALAVWFPVAQQGMAMGIRQTGVTLAGVVAAVMLPPIALALGWSASLRTVAVLALLSVAVFALFYREPGPREHRAAPFRLRQLLRSRPWLFATGFAWVFMGALGCVVAYTTAALHQDAGMGAVRAGLMLALVQVGGVAGRIGWGVLSDRLGGRGPVMALVGFLATLACLGAAAGFGPGTPGWLLAPLVFLLGAAALGWNGLYVTLSAEVGSRRGAATAVGAGTTITFTGLFVAPPIFGAIADRTGTYHWSWVALAALCAAGTALGLAIRDRRRRLGGPVAEAVA
jgi:predicted MFS family arabinose efflux permease